MRRLFVCTRYAGDTAKNVAVAERELGIARGFAFMAVCDEVWIYTTHGVSSGMGRELDHAFRQDKTMAEIKEVRRCPGSRKQ